MKKNIWNNHIEENIDNVATGLLRTFGAGSDRARIKIELKSNNVKSLNDGKPFVCYTDSLITYADSILLSYISSIYINENKIEYLQAAQNAAIIWSKVTDKNGNRMFLNKDKTLLETIEYIFDYPSELIVPLMKELNSIYSEQLNILYAKVAPDTARDKALKLSKEANEPSVKLSENMAAVEELSERYSQVPTDMLKKPAANMYLMQHAKAKSVKQQHLNKKTKRIK